MNSKYLDFEELIIRAVDNSNFEQEDLQNYRNHYETLQKAQPSAENALALSTCLFFLSEVSQSQEVLNSANLPETSRLVPFKHLLTALQLQKQGDFERSLQHFRLSECGLEENPGLQKQVQEKVLDFCISSKNWEKATEKFKEVQKVSPQVLCKIAFCFENQGKNPEAIQFYTLASKCEGQESVLYSFWAEVLKNETVSEKFESLSKDLEPGSRLENDLKFLKALWLVRKGFFDDAEKTLKGVLESSQNDYYWFILGYLYLKKNNIHKAYTCTLKSLKINQSFPESWFNLAVVYHRVRQNEAQSALDRAQKLGISIQDLTEPLLAKVQIWNLRRVAAARPKRPAFKEPKKKPEIIVPTAVKVNPMSFPFAPNVLMCYKMFDYLVKKSQQQKDSENSRSPDEQEMADILTHLNLPSKRSRSQRE